MNRAARSQSDVATRRNLLRSHCELNEKIIRNGNSLNAPHDGSNIRKTNEWAESILKDLDNLILSNERYTASLSNPISANVATAGPPKSPQKRSTIINVVLRKTTPSPSPTSPTAPTAFGLPAQNQTVINAPAKDNNKIAKPEKHVSRLTSFALLSCSRFMAAIRICATVLLLSRHLFSSSLSKSL